MLIRNDQERQEAGMAPLGWLCGACHEELSRHYPIIFVGDRNETGYHLACAAALAAEINDTIADYLAEISATEAPGKAQPPAQTEEQWTMGRAFREAARLSPSVRRFEDVAGLEYRLPQDEKPLRRVGHKALWSYGPKAAKGWLATWDGYVILGQPSGSQERIKAQFDQITTVGEAMRAYRDFQGFACVRCGQPFVAGHVCSGEAEGDG